ncbi:hypothetical protein CINS5955_01800 [Campylobacter insulaenigrae]|uniref:hypothetical protein n=1 Tax=Campylobacter insulaenigrae TaxID=260714 RepID=UPI002152E013|nr:hypothetical protein [Campylobacter insulaenigrae]MCR6578183.1 hypothetical protein [Campylobacter insulaenigrae]
MLSFFRKYILQLLVCICYDKKQYTIRCHTWKQSKAIDTFEKTFEDKDRAIEYVKDLSKDFQIYYIVTFFTSIAQGVVPNSNYKELLKYGVDSNAVKCLPLNNALTYAANIHLELYQKNYEEFGGLDLLYSPFFLLYHCIEKKGFDDKVSLYVYRYHDFVAMLICKNKEIYFGSYFDIASCDEEEIFEDINKQDDEFDFDQEFQLDKNEDEIDNDEEKYELKSLDEMTQDAEELDTLKNIQEEYSLENLANFSVDMKMIEFIINGVKEFYNNPLYNNSFLEKIVIFDEENFNNTSLDYLENELFIRPDIELIDTLDIMNELVVKDLKL